MGYHWRWAAVQIAHTLADLRRRGLVTSQPLPDGHLWSVP